MTHKIKISRAHHTRQAIVIMEAPERYQAIHGDQKDTTATIIRDHLDREVTKLERTMRRVNFLRQALKQEEAAQ